MESRLVAVVQQLARTLLLLAIPAFAAAGEAARVVFIAGKVDVEGRAAVLNGAVQEGAGIKTGADGYVYLKTVDNGFLILRPNSEARIASYHIDQTDPSNTRIKLELMSGVARSISGDAVKQARQNFRFNTPVAAIGVRGTDFTVYTTQETSRVAVISGGVVVSGFNSECAPQGTGPCNGAATAELFARQQGQLLQISKDQTKPQLFNGSGLTPDAISPPRPDEPGGKSGAHGNVSPSPALANEPNLDPGKAGGIMQGIVPAIVPAIVPPAAVVSRPEPILANTIIWGRWTEVLGQAANVDVKNQSEAKPVAMNNYYALFQAKDSEWQMPASGSMGFALKDSQAVVFDAARSTLSAATLENARLQLDFAKASFSTGFDLVAGQERFALQAQGTVSSAGILSGDSQFSRPTNMAVNGVVTAEKGGTAAYLFTSVLDNGRLASGATYWGKQ